jgi:hypothetical protein
VRRGNFQLTASCKQVLTIALAVVLFDLSISPTNGVGILLTLIGGVSRACDIVRPELTRRDGTATSSTRRRTRRASSWWTAHSRHDGRAGC